jgi:hypothetical protein
MTAGTPNGISPAGDSAAVHAPLTAFLSSTLFIDTDGTSLAANDTALSPDLPANALISSSAFGVHDAVMVRRGWIEDVARSVKSFCPEECREGQRIRTLAYPIAVASSSTSCALVVFHDVTDARRIGEEQQRLGNILYANMASGVFLSEWDAGRGGQRPIGWLEKMRHGHARDSRHT